MDDLLDQAPCGFCAFSDDGSVLTANATLRDWLGYGPDEMTGRHVESLFSSGGRVFYQTHFFPLLKMHERADEIYLSLRTKSGNEVPVMANAVRRERAGRFVSDCVFVPMRRRNRYEDEILQAKKALETANARLQARADQEALLGRIGQTIRTAATPGEVLEAAVRELGEALGADRCYFAAYDQDEDSATAGPEWHRPGLTPIAGEYPMSSFAVNQAADYKAGHTQAIPDVGDDPAARRLGLRALLRVPLRAGAAMTALAAAMANGPRAWTPAEVAMVEAVATQTQSALEAVRVRRREHNIAEQLQTALQPPLPAGVAGLALAKHYEAALEEAGVGGDFYDVFPLEKGCTVLAVGDVSGKGLAAAAQVATLRNMLRAFLYSKPTLADAVTDLNRVLALNGLLSGFATLWVGCYDGATGTLAYVNLGQEPALLRRASTGLVEELRSTGPILGALENASYQEQTVSLAPGDILVAFTDGVTECGASRHAMFGIAGVTALLRPPFTPDESAGAERLAEAVTQRLVAGVAAASRGGVAKDDVCLLTAVVQGGAPQSHWEEHS